MPAFQPAMLFDQLLSCHPISKLHLLDLLAEVTLGLRIGVPGSPLVLVSQGVKHAEIFVRQRHEILDDLLLEIELRIQLLQSGKGSLINSKCGRRRIFLPGNFVAVDRSDQFRLLFDLLTKPRQALHITFAALDLFVQNDAIEALTQVHQLLGEIQVRAANKSELIKDLLHLEFRLFDALGDLDLLLSGQQRDLPHLLEVHAHGVVQDVELTVGFLILFFLFLAILAPFLDAVDVGRIDNFDLHGPKLGDDRFHAVGVIHALRQSLIEVVIGDVALFLGQLDQFAHLLLQSLMKVLRSKRCRCGNESRLGIAVGVCARESFTDNLESWRRSPESELPSGLGEPGLRNRSVGEVD